MADVRSLIDEVRTLPGCTVREPAGYPVIDRGHILPSDLVLFFDLCGGLVLFEDADYGLTVRGPGDFLPANPIIVGGQYPEDITSSWYLIASSGADQHISIDLRPSRLGRCYDSYLDRHGIVGSCPIVALSFTQLLQRLVAGRGTYWYWLEETFQPLGDAYD